MVRRSGWRDALRWATCVLLQPGGTPKHVAFVMDGNRRYAAEHGIQKLQGHVQGYSKVGLALHEHQGSPFLALWTPEQLLLPAHVRANGNQRADCQVELQWRCRAPGLGLACDATLPIIDCNPHCRW
jgi:hypothetical protein